MSVPSSKYRLLSPRWAWISKIVTVGVIIATIFSLWNIAVAGRVMGDTAFIGLLLAFSLGFVFIIIPATKKSPGDRVPWYDLVLAALGLTGGVWLFIFSAPAQLYGWDVMPPTHALVISIILWGLAIEASRRSVGLLFSLIVLTFSLYPLFAQFMPGFLSGKSFTFTRVAAFHALSDLSILGIPMSAFARLVIGFMLFAEMLQATGGGRFFLNVALGLLGRVRGGPAKVAVFGSSLFGTISGTVIANVLSVGSVTIPLMKKSGYPAHYAASIEACSSTGGVLMPPVMGVVAFVMAGFLGIPYITVVKAAIVPAILYYIALFAQADFFAAKKGIKGVPRAELPSLVQSFKEGWIYLFSIVALIYLMVWVKVEGWAPFYATALMFAGAMLSREHRLRFKAILIEFLGGSFKTLVELGAMMAGVGMIIGGIALTGAGVTFAQDMAGLAMGNLYLLLLLGAVASFIMGMGLTSIACYIFLAIAVAPGLIKFGLDPVAVHLFILYWGMVSFITPPVALGAIAAAGVAGANAMRTGLQSMKLGAVIYFIPFFFVLEPALILHGQAIPILLSIVTAVVGILLIAGGLEGYFFKVGLIPMLLRPLFVISGALLAYPSLTASIIGFGMAVVIILSLLAWRQYAKQPALAS